MLSRIVTFSLRHRWLVLLAALLLMGGGAFTAARMPLDVFPEFVQPQVDIQTEAPGLPPEQVEQLVTRPVETVVLGTAGLESVRSESIQGLSVITAVFREGTDLLAARQNLSERLTEAASQLPAGVDAPGMSPLTSSTMDLLKVGLLSDKKSGEELRTFADWTLRPALQAVPGVARVTVYGGGVARFEIRVDPERLRRSGLSVTDVLTAARLATGVRGAGFIETAAQRLVVESRGQTLTPEQLGQALVSRGTSGTPVTLADVADVVRGTEPAFGDARIMGRPGVLLAMAGQYGANTLSTTAAVEAALEDLKPMLAAEGITLVPALHRPATFITNALEGIRRNLAMGGMLVGAVLLLFLRDWRTALISFLAIPLSLLAAVLILHARGEVLNTMTLGGFAVAIGVVVDDAIIDVENILRRLRENALLTVPRSAFSVILAASLEVRSAVVHATFVVTAVFVPVLMLSGIQGRFFAPLGQAFILATLASLGMALTVTPALCLLLLRTRDRAPRREPAWLRGLRWLHRRALSAACARPWAAAGLAFLLLLGSLTTLPWFRAELLPEFREGHFVAALSTAPGTSLPEMMRLGERISAALLRHPRIATVEQQAGRAEQGEDTFGPHRCEFHIELKPGPASGEAAVQEDIRRILQEFPGTRSEVLTFLGDRIGETLTGETAQVVLRIFGEAAGRLDQAAASLARMLQAQPGAVDVQIKNPPGAPRLVAALKPEALSRLGFFATDILDAVGTAVQGTRVAEVFDNNRTLPVTVVLDPAKASRPEDLAGLLVSNTEGSRVPLRELADVFPSTGPFSLTHYGARRCQTVTCNAAPGQDLSAFVDRARQAAAALSVPSGTYVEWSGAAGQQGAARLELLEHAALAAAAVVGLLGFVFPRPRLVILVLANVPFALAGGLLASFAAGGVLSIGALVGFVTLFGISMRNSIMLISHYRHLVSHEGADWCRATAILGAEERFLPILMTALVTALGLLPLALGHGGAGSEIEEPMAIVILGGLVSSTLLNLVVLPALALRWGQFGESPSSNAVAVAAP